MEKWWEVNIERELVDVVWFYELDFFHVGNWESLKILSYYCCLSYVLEWLLDHVEDALNSMRVMQKGVFAFREKSNSSNQG